MSTISTKQKKIRERWLLILEKLKQGKKTREIAEDLGLEEKSLRVWMSRNRQSHPDLDYILNRLANGASPEEISRDLGYKIPQFVLRMSSSPSEKVSVAQSLNIDQFVFKIETQLTGLIEQTLREQGAEILENILAENLPLAKLQSEAIEESPSPGNPETENLMVQIGSGLDALVQRYSDLSNTILQISDLLENLNQGTLTKADALEQFSKFDEALKGLGHEFHDKMSIIIQQLNSDMNELSQNLDNLLKGSFTKVYEGLDVHRNQILVSQGNFWNSLVNYQIWQLEQKIQRIEEQYESRNIALRQVIEKSIRLTNTGSDLPSNIHHEILGISFPTSDLILDVCEGLMDLSSIFKEIIYLGGILNRESLINTYLALQEGAEYALSLLSFKLKFDKVAYARMLSNFEETYKKPASTLLINLPQKIYTMAAPILYTTSETEVHDSIAKYREGTRYLSQNLDELIDEAKITYDEDKIKDLDTFVKDQLHLERALIMQLRAKYDEILGEIDANLSDMENIVQIVNDAYVKNVWEEFFKKSEQLRDLSPNSFDYLAKQKEILLKVKVFVELLEARYSHLQEAQSVLTNVGSPIRVADSHMRISILFEKETTRVSSLYFELIQRNLAFELSEAYLDRLFRFEYAPQRETIVLICRNIFASIAKISSGLNQIALEVNLPSPLLEFSNRIGRIGNLINSDPVTPKSLNQFLKALNAIIRIIYSVIVYQQRSETLSAGLAEFQYLYGLLIEKVDEFKSRVHLQSISDPNRVIQYLKGITSMLIRDLDSSYSNIPLPRIVNMGYRKSLRMEETLTLKIGCSCIYHSNFNQNTPPEIFSMDVKIDPIKNAFGVLAKLLPSFLGGDPKEKVISLFGRFALKSARRMFSKKREDLLQQEQQFLNLLMTRLSEIYQKNEEESRLRPWKINRYCKLPICNDCSNYLALNNEECINCIGNNFSQLPNGQYIFKVELANKRSKSLVETALKHLKKSCEGINKIISQHADLTKANAEISKKYPIERIIGLLGILTARGSLDEDAESMIAFLLKHHPQRDHLALLSDDLT